VRKFPFQTLYLFLKLILCLQQPVQFKEFEAEVLIPGPDVYLSTTKTAATTVCPNRAKDWDGDGEDGDGVTAHHQHFHPLSPPSLLNHASD
jgi:hypothetical protein